MSRLTRSRVPCSQGHARQISTDRGPRFDQSENVQQLHRWNEVRDRDDGRVQRDRPCAAKRGIGFPTGQPLRTRRCLQTARRGPRAGNCGRHRGGLLGVSGRAGRTASSRARHRGRNRLRAPLLPRICHAARPQRRQPCQGRRLRYGRLPQRARAARARFASKEPQPPEAYFDLSFYKEAIAGM